jgi:uncharacterized protein YbaP (TraB family)
MRPWRAYYAFASAFAARRSAAPREPDYPDRVLLNLAKKSGKSLRYEYPSFDAFIQFLAGMPDDAQSQYIAWLLDYFDAETGARPGAEYGWMTGDPDAASLERMRRRSELYRMIQTDRNRGWAQRIANLLDAEGTSFVAIGLLHVLGPDGIPQQLQRMGVNLTESAQWRASPRQSDAPRRGSRDGASGSGGPAGHVRHTLT